MSKRKITQQQARRVAHKQSLSLQQRSRAVVVARYGHRVALETETLALIRCPLRQHLGDVVVGDVVMWEESAPEQYVITAREPRRSVLHRMNKQGQLKAIAANIDQLLLTVAPVPGVETLLLDSYLVAAAHLQIEPIVLLNKSDLLDRPDHPLRQLGAVYASLGYRVVETSHVVPDSLQALTTLMEHKASVFVGQSGVGKSTLVQALMPDISVRTAAAMGSAHAHGKHTTTTAQRYRFSQDAVLIDVPGIRELLLWPMTAEELAYGFVEFQPFLKTCLFRDCQHSCREKGCALQAALAAGKIYPHRLENYLKILMLVASKPN